jgi:hypothetical protein
MQERKLYLRHLLCCIEGFRKGIRLSDMGFYFIGEMGKQGECRLVALKLKKPIVTYL